jgi:hypothetical protein
MQIAKCNLKIGESFDVTRPTPRTLVFILCFLCFLCFLL